MSVKNDPKSRTQPTKTPAQTRTEPKAKAAAPRTQPRRDELSVGRGRALRQAAEKNLGARPFSASGSAALVDGLRIGPGGALTKSLSASGVAVTKLGVASSRVTLSPTVDAASKAVDAAFASGGPLAAANELDRQIVNLSPADQKALYEASKATIDQVLAGLERLDKNDTRQAVTSLSELATKVGPDAVKDLAGRLAQVIPNGHVGDFDDGFVAAIEAGVGPELALATADALRAAGKPNGARDIEAAVVDGIGALQSDVKDAAAQQAELESRLQSDLASYGTASMTPAQRRVYEEAFWAIPEHAKVKARAEQTSAALDHALTVAGPRLEKLAAAGDVKAASALLLGYEQLAKFPQYAEAAIRWAGRAGNDPALTRTLDFAAKLGTDGKFHGDATFEGRLESGLLSDGTASLQTQLLSEHAGEPDAQAQVLAALKSIYADYKTAKGFVKLGKEVAKFLSDTEAVIKNPRSITDIAAGWGKKSPFQKASALFSVVTGLYKTGKDVANGDYLKGALDALKTADGGLELTAGILAGYAGAAGAAGDAAKFIDKYAPIIGAVVDVIQLGQDVGELLHDPNAGEIIKAVGSIISLVGDAFPVVGGVAKAAGTVVHAIGDWLDSLIEGNDKKKKLTREQVELLVKATGLDPDTAKELVTSRPSTLSRLVDLGFTPEQIRALAKDPTINLSSQDAQVAVRTAALFGLDEKETVEFIHRLIEGGHYGDGGTTLSSVGYAFGVLPSGVDADRINIDHDFSELQAFAAGQIELLDPELAAWVRSHQGPANYDTVYAETVYGE